jgi:hypothetical protein
MKGGKIFDSIQHPFMIKSPEETRNRRDTPQYNKSCMKNINSQHPTKWRKTEIVSFEVRNETRVSTLPTCIQYSV